MSDDKQWSYPEYWPPPSLSPMSPNDVLLTGVDFSNAITSIPQPGVFITDVLNMSVYPMTSPGLGITAGVIAANSTGLPASQINFTLAGGMVGTTYTITIGVRFSNGNVLYRSVLQPIESR